MLLPVTEDQLAIQALARDFTAKESKSAFPSYSRAAVLTELWAVVTPKAQEHDRTMAYPTEIIRKAWDAGLLNGHIPEAYGGPELSIHTLAVISEELAFGCTGEVPFEPHSRGKRAHSHTSQACKPPWRPTAWPRRLSSSPRATRSRASTSQG